MSLLRLTGDLTIGVLKLLSYTSTGLPKIIGTGGEAEAILLHSVENSMGCWLWTGRRHNCGYGQIKVDSRDKMVHRISYEAFIGPIPEGLLIRHRCHEKLCCNPLHLEPGTDRDNWLDMLVDGHTRLIEQNGSDNLMAKLTEEQVYEIRERFKTGKILSKELAKEYGVARRAIERTICGTAYSCYTKIPPYDWRDLDVEMFHDRLTRKGKAVIEKMLLDGLSRKEILNKTNFTPKMIYKVANQDYKDL